MFNGIHHAAIITANYAISKHFYVHVLGLKVLAEHYRASRHSYKLDLGLADGSQVELFSFIDSPARLSYPEARGLRHLAFTVTDLCAVIKRLQASGVTVEPVRIDEYTGHRYTFFADPDGLPLELVQSP